MICLLALALGASSAQAASTHILTRTFGAFNNPVGVAVDDSTNPADPAAGDVYVADSGGHRVVRFDPSGNPADFSASGANISGDVLSGPPSGPFNTPDHVAVDPANGDFYVGDAGGEAVYKFDPAGNLTTTIDRSSGVPVGGGGAFNPYGIVVDPSNESGDFYVENRGYYNGDGYTQGDQIAKFESSGNYGNGGIFATGPLFGVPPVDNFAMNSAGDFYVVLEGQSVMEYTATGSPVAPLDTNAPTAVAIDPATGDIYVAENSPKRLIREFNPEGQPIDSFGLNSFGSTYGLAVDREHTVYVTDNSGTVVKEFLQATPPAVTTNSADEITAHSARLVGTVDPAGNGEITSCSFEYGTNESYTLGDIPCEQGSSISTMTRVSAEVTGLAPSTTYHFRLIAANASANSANHGGDQALTTSLSDTKRPVESFGAGPLNTPIGVSVDNSTNPEDPSAGDVYVDDFNDGRVIKFDEEGNELSKIEGLTSPILSAVDPTNGDLYVVEYGTSVDKFDPTGSPVTGFGTSGKITMAGTPVAVAVSPSNGDLYVGVRGTNLVQIFDSSGNPITQLSVNISSNLDSITVNGAGDVYVVDEKANLTEYKPSANPPTAATTFDAGTVIDANGAFAVALDPSNEDIYVAETAPDQIRILDPSGNTVDTFGANQIGESAGIGVNGISGSSRDQSTYVADINANVVYILGATGVDLPEVGTGDASKITRTSAELTGVVEPSEGTISKCYFAINGGTHLPCEPTPPIAGRVQVTAQLDGLEPATSYGYQLVAENANGSTDGQEEVFTTIAEPPELSGLTVTGVRSDLATLHAVINPNKADTTYHFEYVTTKQFETNGFAEATRVPTTDDDAGSGGAEVAVSEQTGVLTAGSQYHFKVSATNSGGTSSAERTFSTYSTGSPTDTCTNAHVRQQTEAAQLPDCRAYELVSAPNTGGYAVESTLVPGQMPFGGYPQASGATNSTQSSRLLYGVHFGGIAGVGDPTNKGVDPYIANRGTDGWSTEYVGIPGSGTPSKVSFASTLLEADPSLDNFAFGGMGICSPCFTDGSSGIPLHLSDGSLVQGMTGAIAQPSATPDGHIAKYFSADGSHFVFGSTSKFAEGGNQSTGDASIYDRSLKTNETHVVSNSPEGHPLACLQGTGDCHSPGDGNGIAELGISRDGSRIVVAQKVETDAEGNVYWHLYMDIGDAAKTVDLTPGATHGVLFDGMSEDGSRVFFTTRDKLLAADTDSSADIYMAEIDSQGTVTLHLISTTNSDACNPVENEERPHWNTVGATANCDAVAIGGGGGIGTTSGSIYFLSPELLDGPANGSANQPNLYLAGPGVTPRFIATLEADNPLVIDSVGKAEAFNYSNFQVTQNGDFAAFTSALPLTPTVENAGFEQVYRYDALSEELDCVSCNPTGGIDTGDGSLSYLGLGLTNDGRVFFDSTQALAARDQDEKSDVYEWEAEGRGTPACASPKGCVNLISTGTSRFDSELLGVSADGTDAFFFTRDTLVPQDENGTLAKIYDARELGGFPYIPPPVPCKASDECHGPSSPIPPPPSFGTLAGSGGDYTEASPSPGECKKGFVKRHGKCAKKNHRHKPHRKGHRRHG